jgi:RNA polymerase sigma factor (sigma-70 family)
VEKGRREDFFERLRKHINFLRPYARRELRSLELGGLLHRSEVSVDDLLDDTLEEWIKQEPRRHASLEERADKVSPTVDGPREDEDDWWAPLLGEEETLTLGDLIPDADATEAWEQLDAEEQTDRLLSLLRELPKPQRQAFLLHALENVSTAEIAMLQGRPEGEVKADIEAARRTLKERLLARGDVREAGMAATATAASAASGTAGN